MRSLTVTVVVVVLGLILLMSGCNSYNSFVDMDENVENAWGKVQSTYQRRADLIPNLVSTVKGAAAHEKETLEAVVKARSKATSMNIDPSKSTPEQMKAFQEAQSGLSQSLGRLMMITENYPQLQANSNFRELQAQLEGTENRIKVERDRYNDVVTAYNKKVRRFPSSFFAKIFSFGDRAQFEAQEGSDVAPNVEF
jgi:LemA protein